MLPDAQAAFEKMLTGLAHAAAGVNLIWGAGNLESTLTMSPEALVMDDEIAGYFLRYRRGFEVSDESIALDVVRRIGAGGDYLSSEHTLMHHRSVLSRANLAYRDRHAMWQAKGSPSFADAVRERLAVIAGAEPGPCLEPAQERELLRIEAAGMAGLA